MSEPYDQEDQSFQEIAERAGHLVGSGELALRELMGDQQYETNQAFGFMFAAENLARLRSKKWLTRAKGVFWVALAAAITGFAVVGNWVLVVRFIFH